MIFPKIKAGKVFGPNAIHLEFPRQARLLLFAEKLFEAIRDRIVSTQTLADGQKTPPIRTKWTWVNKADPRFKGLGAPSKIAVIDDKMVTDQSGGLPSRFFPKGYGQLKIAMGKAPVNDGLLTGDMWANPSIRIEVYPASGETHVKLSFAGSSITSKMVVTEATATKASAKKRIAAGKAATQTERFGNRDKAWVMQRRGADGKRTPTQQFKLLAPTQKEVEDVRDAYLSEVRLVKGVAG